MPIRLSKALKAVLTEKFMVIALKQSIHFKKKKKKLMRPNYRKSLVKFSEAAENVNCVHCSRAV